MAIAANTQKLLDAFYKIVSNSGGTDAISEEIATVLETVVPLIANVPKAPIALVDDYTVTAEDHDILITMGTDAKTITLPPTIAGHIVRVSNVGADGNNIITISPDAADGIAGTVTLAASVVQMDGTVNKDFILTKATALLGDGCVLIGTGVTGTSAWLIVSSTGIWAQGA
jgi:hypothetical protein